MSIKPGETEIRGALRRVGNRVEGDENCRRIDELLQSQLKEVARDQTGWETLYLDPGDGRLWELTYPQGELHGGGPPLLRHLAEQEARNKYGGPAVDYARQLQGRMR